MDLLNKKIKELNLYEVKAYVRKAQNVVYNFTEMESKVREATNNEPWGASSSLMQQIAAGTYNFREREEIIGMIFRRFTEKAANEWRQIYKSLQLLEYLVKNGSERLVDDARANLSVITMLRSFHYIDSKGQDQGINVRNRSKAVIALLNDEALIRAERKKARENAKKFGGVASSDVGGAYTARPSRHQTTFDDEDSNRVYGDGGVYGERYEETRSAGQQQFEEYDVAPVSNRAAARAGAAARTRAPVRTSAPVAEVNLVSFDDDAAGSNADVSPVANGGDADSDDDFDDFQTASPAPVSTGLNLNGLYANSSLNTASPAQTFGASSQTFGAPAQTFGAPAQTFGISSQTFGAPSQTFGAPSTPATGSTMPAIPAAKADAFSSLFSSAISTAHAVPAVKSPVSHQPTPTASAPDDDFFGETATAAKPVAAPPSSLANDFDLLSF